MGHIACPAHDYFVILRNRVMNAHVQIRKRLSQGEHKALNSFMPIVDRMLYFAMSDGIRRDQLVDYFHVPIVPELLEQATASATFSSDKNHPPNGRSPGEEKLRKAIRIRGSCRRAICGLYLLTVLRITVALGHSLRMQMLQRLHPHLSSLQGGDAFGGGAGGRQA